MWSLPQQGSHHLDSLLHRTCNCSRLLRRGYLYRSWTKPGSEPYSSYSDFIWSAICILQYPIRSLREMVVSDAKHLYSNGRHDFWLRYPCASLLHICWSLWDGHQRPTRGKRSERFCHPPLCDGVRELLWKNQTCTVSTKLGGFPGLGRVHESITACNYYGLCIVVCFWDFHNYGW